MFVIVFAFAISTFLTYLYHCIVTLIIFDIFSTKFKKKAKFKSVKFPKSTYCRFLVIFAKLSKTSKFVKVLPIHLKIELNDLCVWHTKNY